MRSSRKTPAAAAVPAAIPVPAAAVPTADIRIHDARQNNLRGFDLDIPVGKLVVVTGLSGAGKSSLVFDTLHAEGQRRYVETFSPYTRQFLDLLPAPDVGSIENIRPSIAIQQGNTIKTSRSTVGTMTELCDWFKVWFANRAQLHDPETGEPIRAHHPENVWEELSAEAEAAAATASADIGAGCSRHAAAATRVLLGFDVSRPAKMKWPEALAPFIAQGYTRGVFALQHRQDCLCHTPSRSAPGKSETRVPSAAAAATRLEDAPASAAECVILQDTVPLAPAERERFVEAATAAFRLGRGCLRVSTDAGATFRSYHNTPVSRAGRRFRPATPALFSFNTPIGACPACRGFGRVIGTDWAKIIPDPTKSLAAGAIAPFLGKIYGESQRDLLRCAAKQKFPVNTPWRELTDAQRSFVLDGEPGYGTGTKKWPRAWYGVKEFFTWLEKTSYKMHVRVFLSRYRGYSTCPACGGARLQPDALCWQWQHRTLPALYELPVSTLLALLAPHRVPNARHPADQALDAILARLTYLADVGLGYLTLNRQSRTLSGGEVQRVNLTACLGAALADALFVLDEPSVGLHPRDLGRMTGILRRLVGQGNTVVVVEHDESVMRAADHLIEIGPRPGRDGGHLVFSGPPAAIADAQDSVTGPWLTGAKHPRPAAHRPVDASTPCLRLRDIHANNLRGLALDIPLGRFTAICGVSGSGKSTLLNQVLAQLNNANNPAAPAAAALATAPSTADADSPVARFTHTTDLPFGAIALVDQSPASRTPRSNAALYTGAWDHIRKLLAASPGAEEAGLTPAHFSFNSGDGRCPHCGGSGWETVEMQFLADVHVPCPVCSGKRFRPEILQFKHREKTVADILEMTVDEARAFFGGEGKTAIPGCPEKVGEAHHATPATTPTTTAPTASGTATAALAPAAAHSLALLSEVGLGYLTLGQPLSTLSGGEAQRLKLARFLGSVSTTKNPTAALAPAAPGTLILLDEPTTGLHREDVARLLDVLQRLVDARHTLVVVEHNTDVLLAADWLLELGPEAGDAGGHLIAAAPPAAVARAATPTAPYLRPHSRD